MKLLLALFLFGDVVYFHYEPSTPTPDHYELCTGPTTGNYTGCQSVVDEPSNKYPGKLMSPVEVDLTQKFYHVMTAAPDTTSCCRGNYSNEVTTESLGESVLLGANRP